MTEVLSLLLGVLVVLAITAVTGCFVAALKEMRETRNHLAVVTDDGAVLSVVTLSDVLRWLFPQPATA